MSSEAAVAAIIAHFEEDVTFEAEKFVLEALSYMRREDYPAALVYAAVEFIRRRLAAAEQVEMAAGLKRLKQDDTEFEFAENAAFEAEFEALKPKLRLYRRVVAW